MCLLNTSKDKVRASSCSHWGPWRAPTWEHHFPTYERALALKSSKINQSPKLKVNALLISGPPARWAEKPSICYAAAKTYWRKLNSKAFIVMKHIQHSQSKIRGRGKHWGMLRRDWEQQLLIQHRHTQAGWGELGDASFPSGSMKYSSLFPCKKGLLKLSDCFEIMTGVTQISSLSSLLSKAPEPGLTAQSEYRKNKKSVTQQDVQQCGKKISDFLLFLSHWEI